MIQGDGPEMTREATSALPFPLSIQRISTAVDPKLCTAMGNALFEADWAEGRAMTLEQTIEYALHAEA
jgi:hypothetical protein